MVTKKNFAVIEEVIGARGNPNRKETSKKKPNRKETSKKKQNIKLTTLTEEPFDEKAIADEGFSHNHQECIKAQNMAMDMNDFLETLGLANGFSKELPSLKTPESPPRFLEMMHEESFFDRSAKKFDDSPPTSPDHDQMWKHINDWIDPIVNFKLSDNPKLLKH